MPPSSIGAARSPVKTGGSFTSVMVKVKVLLLGALLSSLPSSTLTAKVTVSPSAPSCVNVTCPAASWVPVKVDAALPFTVRVRALSRLLTVKVTPALSSSLSV